MLTAIKDVFASISASVTPSVRVSRASSITTRRPSTSRRERRTSVISRENCKNKKNHKNESQKKLESLIFSSTSMFEIEKTTTQNFRKQYKYNRIDRIRIWNKFGVGDEQFTLSFSKALGAGSYGIVYLLTGKSVSGDELNITIKTMLNNDEKYIGRDLMKSDCEILRVKVFGDENVKGSRKAANFNAFMEPASDSLHNYATKNKLTKEQILDIGQQILERFKMPF